MATNTPLFLPLVMVALFLQTAYGGDLGVYWGQDSDEGTLSEACATRKYASINIAFLNQFGHGRKPEFNLTAGHCGPSSSGCQAAIRECQSKGVKVFLSNGATDGNYSLASKDDAKNMADYLWNSYLGGKSSSRPLREAVLDGIDFTLEAGAPTDFYSDLAGFLSGYSTQGNKAIKTPC
ncbi:hevamine-A-like [Punica granatum]|uniref:chitinase n=1 Tax=Punica granatum TaxID=22663 RepID=A0A6P8C329_PUNGR|nr:hevamine-A-like [Punica granatum]